VTARSATSAAARGTPAAASTISAGWLAGSSSAHAGRGGCVLACRRSFPCLCGRLRLSGRGGGSWLAAAGPPAVGFYGYGAGLPGLTRSSFEHTPLLVEAATGKSQSVSVPDGARDSDHELLTPTWGDGRRERSI
jgi:hypothetical protein